MKETIRANKVLHGQFFTVSNPFNHPMFADWLKLVAKDKPFIEPFAGANNIVKLISELGELQKWKSFDIEPKSKGIKKADTIKNFPKGFKTGITNPPYLAKNSATRKGLKVDFRGYDDLYKVAIGECLSNLEYLAAIIPESFITSGLFTDRLFGIVSLTSKMFDDTECPVCLALWIKQETNDFKFYSGENVLGNFSILKRKLPLADKLPNLKFNDATGQIGLMAIDSTSGPSIRFCRGSEIDSGLIKYTSRSITRIHIPNFKGDTLQLVEEGNRILRDFRTDTGDVFLTAFKGLRRDGKYRRRLDFETARRILGLALQNLGVMYE